MEIYLIRHTSVDVAPHTCYGQTDVPLKDSFQEEARLVLQNLEGITFDKVFTSPLSRCVHLANYCGYADAERDPRIMEMDFGEWEMKHYDEIRDPRLQEWYKDFMNVSVPGGESFADQYKRVSEFLDDLRSEQANRIAVFAHGGVLICAQVYAKTVKPEEAFSVLTPYGGIIKIEL
ncbi:alpha-ribazole phosphatase [uncultured Bacteroides sp.]|uniref:alpha-ribazole phosphatase n=1 Tax=uncultured Bacteroides sp. TaxID=162156 RepID=UPI002AA94020|nr:alpha-ribazole phosphatase [uncultured Bacteroides sp.]